VPRPVIALLTDFGLRDHYVAAMKGVILGICPDATLLDITHDVAPQDIVGGALELEAVVPYLPDDTIVVGVVDPGVGSERRAVAIDATRVRFVGPDNGLFDLALRAVAGEVTAVSLTDPQFHRPVMSRTFEGRDRFGPVAAHLANGVTLTSLGPRVTDLQSIEVPDPVVGPASAEGVVLRVDHFGNLVTNIGADHVQGIGEDAHVSLGNVTIAGISATYADAAPGSLCALIGSSGRLEVAVSGGSAARALGVARGARVTVRRRMSA